MFGLGRKRRRRAKQAASEGRGEDDAGRKSGRAKSRKKGRRSKSRGLIASLFYWGAVSVVWGAMAVVALALYVMITLPGGSVFKLPEREPGITVLDANGGIMARRGAFHGDKVLLEELPAHVPQAVIATEDRRFYSHLGIDPLALVRATVVNLRAGRVVQGGSTITQQLAKNLFLKPERTFKRKIHEALLSLWIEGLYTKDEILQLYLNRVYFGAGAFGVDAAAKRFFGKSAREVSLPEAALLAAVLKAPSRYSPSSHPERARKRAQLVLEKMVQSGFITDLEGKIAEDGPAPVARGPATGQRQYAVDWVTELVPKLVGKLKSDLIVETTLDPRMQAIAEAELAKVMDAKGKKRKAEQAALVTLDHNGAVLALIGGRSYAASQFNRAVTARRQPGSAFKPFVYITAMEHGLTPDTVVVDEPITIKGWRPKNYSGKHAGPVTLREGLARSINTIAARITAHYGPDEIARTARRMGITSELHSNPSLSLGTAEVSLLELTSAYLPLANGGDGVLPHVIVRISTRDGKVLYERTGSGVGRVLDERTLTQMNDMLSAVIGFGTGRGARLGAHPVAGKTGTSQDFRDAWFIGYTAHYATGVWVGNDSNKAMKRVTGGSLPAEIWRKYMSEAHRGLQVAALPGAWQPERARGLAGLFESLGFGFRQRFGDEPPYGPGWGRDGDDEYAPDRPWVRKRNDYSYYNEDR